MSAAPDFELVEEVHIAAPPERVFRALTDPLEITAWWRLPGHYETTDARIDLRVGGSYRLSGTSARRKGFVVTGVYRVVEPPHRLSYTWTPDWEDGARDSIVDFRLEVAGGGTRVVVRHTAFATPSARDDHSQGWPGVLGALRGHLE